MSFFPREIKELLPALISYLDDRGYLDLNIEKMAEKENIPFRLADKALSALQSLEPAGLGARDLKERLLIQLRRKKSRGEGPAYCPKSPALYKRKKIPRHRL